MDTRIWNCEFCTKMAPNLVNSRSKYNAYRRPHAGPRTTHENMVVDFTDDLECIQTQRKAGYTPTRFWESEAVGGSRAFAAPYSGWCVPHRRLFTAPFHNSRGRSEKVGPSNHSDWLFTLPLPAGKDSYCQSSTEVFAVCS